MSPSVPSDRPWALPLVAPGALGLLCLGAGPSVALERTAVPFDGEDLAWSAGATCTITYFNICNSWILLWPVGRERVGVVYETCGTEGGCEVTSSTHYWPTLIDSPAGYGFTGTAGLWAVDANDCPTGTALSAQPFAPVPGWNYQSWSDAAVPGRFAVMIEFPWPLHAQWATDLLQSVGCAPCSATPRTSTRSYRWGSPEHPACPGTPFVNTCYHELMWSVSLACPVHVDERSWGGIKGLYR